MNRMISRAEAAELLKCTEQTVSNMVERGVLKAHMANNRLLIDSDTILQLFDTMEDYTHAKDNTERLAKEYRQLELEYNEKLKDLKYIIGAMNRTFNEEAFKSLFVSQLHFYKDILNPREYQTMEMTVNGYSPQDIADEFQVSIERVRQLIYRAARRIRMNDAAEFLRLENEKLKKQIEQIELENSKTDRQRLMETCIVDLDLSVRALNCLKQAEVSTIGDLMKMSKFDLLKFRNFGRKSMQEIEEMLYSKGLELKER